MRKLPIIAGFFGLLLVWQPAYSESDHNHKGSEEETHHDHDRDHDQDSTKKKKKHDGHKGHNSKEEHKDNKSKDGHDHGAKDSHENHKAHADSHGHDEVEKFGDGKAITAVMNEGESFALSSKSIETLGIQFGNVKQQFKDLIIPSSALVEYQNSTGVYMKRNQWFKLVSVKILKEESDHVVVTSDSLAPGDEIVISRTGFVRVAHLEASGQGGQGHAH